MNFMLSRPMRSATMYRIPTTFDGGAEEAYERIFNVLPGLEQAEEKRVDELIMQFCFEDQLRVERAKWVARLKSRGLLSPNDSANQRVWTVEVSDGGPFSGIFDPGEEFFADNLEAILAGVVEHCVEHGDVPREVNLIGSKIWMRFGDEDLLVIKAWEPRARSFDEVTASRLTGTLCKLGEEDGIEELIRRIERLPGWQNAGIAVSSETEKSSGRASFGFVKDWRRTAECLIAAAGEEASSGLVDKVLCAVFDAPSWHHLTAALRDLEESRFGSEMWSWKFGVDDNNVSRLVFGSTIEAFHKTLTSARSLMDLQGDDRELTMSVRDFYGSIEEVKLSSRVLVDSESDYGRVLMRQLTTLFDQDRRSREVEEYVGGFFERNEPLTKEVLREMLMMNLTADERESKQMALNRQHEISRCVTHRFVLQESQDGKCLHAHPIDAVGRREAGYSFGANISNGALVYEESEGANVLVHRWDQGGSVTTSAVILEMPCELAKNISSLFDETSRREIEQEIAELRGAKLKEWKRRLKREVKWEKARVAQLKKNLRKLAAKARGAQDQTKEGVRHG